MATRMTGPCSTTFCQLDEEKLPISQKTMAGSEVSGSATYCVSEIMAENNASMTIPARTMERIERPATCEIAATRTSAVSAEAKVAANSIAALPPTSRVSVPPSAAPEERPSTRGETSGLRKSACRAAPQSASPAPTIAASRIRGRRTLMSMRSSIVSGAAMPESQRPSICHTSANGMWNRPAAAETKAATARTSTSDSQ